MRWLRTIEHDGVVHGCRYWPSGPMPVWTWCMRRLWKSDASEIDYRQIYQAYPLREPVPERGPCSLGDQVVSCLACVSWPEEDH